MHDWSHDLAAALASGDGAAMKAALSHLPQDVMRRATPYLEAQAMRHLGARRPDLALPYYDQLVQAEPDQPGWRRDRARVYLALGRATEALADARYVVELAPDDALGHLLQAEVHERLQQWDAAHQLYRQVLSIEGLQADVQRRVASLEAAVRDRAAASPPHAPPASAGPAAVRTEGPTLPADLAFDPALFEDAALPASAGDAMVNGLKRHLARYSALRNVAHTLVRLEDPVWMGAWDRALATLAGGRVLLRGSELGVLGARSLEQGAASVRLLEASPLEARIARGVLQKQLLKQWHARHGAQIPQWSEEQRRESFESHTQHVEVVAADESSLAEPDCDAVVFAHLDHALLGTGIVKAVRQHRRSGGGARVRVLPARATLFAMAVQWVYPGTGYRLEPVERLRWSPYPQALELSSEHWRPLTPAVRLGSIDFEDFAETVWDVPMPVVSTGSVEALIFWYELDLGGACLDNAPGSALSCIKPGVQYTDPIEVTQGGEPLSLRVHVNENRLYLQTQPPATRLRTGSLPSWYLRMLGDRRRNDAYQASLLRAIGTRPCELALDIGAGFGLLSMMAAEAGAQHVLACEVDPEMAGAAADVIRLNGMEDRITLLHQDCREVRVPDHSPRRADLAVFELFDCSLIGEGVLHLLAHAREHLLTEHACYLPMGARIRAMVVECRLDQVLGVDVNLLNPYRFSRSFINVDAERLAYRALTAPFDVFSFDFSTATPTPEEKTLDVPCVADGTAGAVLFWFDLQMDIASSLSNAPGSGMPLHWKQGLQWLPELRVGRDVSLPLLARHDGSGLSFQWRADAVPRDAWSSLPRFDPHTVAAEAELEQHTAALLQHCLQHPDEHRQVAALAQRFAIEPARHGLDPSIAQRFAAMILGI